MAASDPADFLKHELFRLLCGEVLGAGAARTVYAHALDPNLVIKFEDGAQSFQNITEWQTWQAVEHTDLAQWFAPCVAISPCGGVLIQHRTCRAARYPDQIPAFFTDTKVENWGILPNGRVVAHDYGLHLMLERGMTKAMRRVRWTTI